MTESERPIHDRKEALYLIHERISICLESGVSVPRAEQIATDEAQRREEKS